MMLRSFLLLLLCTALPFQAARAQSTPDAHPLTLAARVWGLAKYFHPAVTACQHDWDQVLLDAVPALEAAPATVADRSAALSSLLDAAGPGGAQAPDAQTPAWIREAAITEPLRQRLAWLAAQTPGDQCYIQVERYADFDVDAGHDQPDPDRAHRALAAFRFWNVIEYFYPYKPDIGRDWATVLDQFLPLVLAAADREAYVRAMRGLTAAIEDTHAAFGHPFVPAFASAGRPPFELRRIEGRPVVVQVLPQAAPVQPGDEVLEVDGEPVEARWQFWDAMGLGSNPVSRDYINLLRAMGGTANPGHYRLRRPDGSEYTAELPRDFAFAFDSAGGIAGTWETRELAGGCRMGIVDMAKLLPAQVPAMLADMDGTDAIVFDVRNYPNNTLWPLAEFLYPQPRPPSLLARPSERTPGTFESFTEAIGGSTPDPYPGRLLILFDERSISQAEYTVMGLQAAGNATTIGSQTMAADGNITWVTLPGGLRAIFTGIGVYYPDGTPTQRIGIVPDLHRTPTIAGLAAGRDELLETALDCNWLSREPSRRMPDSGLYFDPERSGEGVDIHRDGQLVAALSYGYDDAGQPTWLLAGAPTSDDDWGSRFLAYRDGGGTWQPQPDYTLDFHRGPYAPPCASRDQSTLHPRGLWRWPEGPEAGRCTLPLFASEPGDVTGLWSGPADDLGWGVSLHHADDALVVYVYAYDGAGNPRWLLGQVAWSGSGEVEVPLQHVTGFCRGCPPQAPQYQPAGTLRLALDGGSRTGVLDIDARFGDEARWTRTRMPLQRLVGNGTGTGAGADR